MHLRRLLTEAITHCCKPFHLTITHYMNWRKVAGHSYSCCLVLTITLYKRVIRSNRLLVVKKWLNGDTYGSLYVLKQLRHCIMWAREMFSFLSAYNHQCFRFTSDERSQVSKHLAYLRLKQWNCVTFSKLQVVIGLLRNSICHSSINPQGLLVLSYCCHCLHF